MKIRILTVFEIPPQREAEAYIQYFYEFNQISSNRWRNMWVEHTHLENKNILTIELMFLAEKKEKRFFFFFMINSKIELHGFR